jgi:hypothetical protein
VSNLNNPFVDYLDQYNVLSPNHSKIYDEYTYDHGKASYNFNIETKVEKYLKDLFSNNPLSIILTGNAGDGKTRLCRLIYNAFSEDKLMQWPDSGIIDVEFDKGTIRIVKDLSELREEVIYQELSNLQSFIENDHKEKIYYLIAANEGKLNKFLSQHEDLAFLRGNVYKRFSNHENNDDRFQILNLLDVTSSVYVKRVLKEWNKEENWESCANCAKKQNCVIYLNHERTSKEVIQKRLVEQYRLLDYLNEHITMREMLIHISYLLTGGYTCSDIDNASYEELENQSKKPYYQNFYGHELDKDAFSEMRALKIFRELDPGKHSISLIDDFIVNGDLSGDENLENTHHLLFNDELDMQFGYFVKKLKIYRDHSEDSNDSLVEEWISKLRRKLYFEIPSDDIFQLKKLLPYQFVSEYDELFSDKGKQVRIRKDIINGLNRAFSKRLVKPTQDLHATTENLMIYTSFKSRQVKLEEELEREDIDRIPSNFKLFVDGETTLSLDLAVFEYLLRLNSGNMHSILKNDVDILIDTFKNELIKISEPDEYTLNILRFDSEVGLFIEDEIEIP